MGVKFDRGRDDESGGHTRHRGRRCVLAAAVLLTTALVFQDGTPAAAPACSGTTRNIVRLVSPFAGTDAIAPDVGIGGGAGNTFPGAVAPFGMLQWSPDTVPSATNFSGGYTYTDTTIRGFSLTHMSGVGCPILWDIPFLPTTVPVTMSPSVADSYDVDPNYLPSFSHRGERARPGYYRVWFDRGTPKTIRCELTATT